MAVTKGSGANFIEMSGMRYGNWLVLRRTSDIKTVRWVCQCDCGTTRSVRSSDLRSGKSKSCGCSIKNSVGKTPPSLHRREYNSWTGMKQRCFYPKHIEFHRYGGRGITVCDRWKDDFMQFLQDMGPCPAGMSIDRKDQDGNYSPENCRWATKDQQSANTSRNIRIDYQGNSWTLKQLAAHLDLSYYRLHAYFRRRGLSLEEAIAKVREPGINRPYRYKPESA